MEIRWSVTWQGVPDAEHSYEEIQGSESEALSAFNDRSLAEPGETVKLVRSERTILQTRVQEKP